MTDQAGEPDTCVGPHGLACPCFAEAEANHGERCLFGTCRAIQRAELNGDRKLAAMISRASGMLFTPDRPTIVGHSGGACCPCTCDEIVSTWPKKITSLEEYRDAVESITGTRP